MKSKMGYIIIVIGLVLVVWGIAIVRKPQKGEIIETIKAQTVKEETKPTLEDKEQLIRLEAKPIIDEKRELTKVETESKVNEKVQQEDYDENKAKGDAFEKFVVKNFSRKYFTLQEWRSDKYVDGIYAVSNHFPDLEVIFNFKEKGVNEAFAIECKWRGYYYKNEIKWAENYQINNYKEYAEKLNIPVFVVIGVGGEPKMPEELFIVPLQEMKSNTITKSELANYKKDISDTRFFWDYEKNKLR
ncbi:MAG: hypothetical protein ACOYM7_11540 [Paludibacter sp.]